PAASPTRTRPGSPVSESAGVSPANPGEAPAIGRMDVRCNGNESADFVTRPRTCRIAPGGGGPRTVNPPLTKLWWDFTGAEDTSDRGAHPPVAALHVSVLASDLPVRKGHDRPVRRSRVADRVEARSPRGVRADDGAARERPALLREAGPGALPGHPPLLPH